MLKFYTSKQSAGRFDAMARNATAPHYPRRIGFIVGCPGHWLAERGPRLVGHYSTRKAALAALAALEEA